jgi:hypothetical protein
VEVAIDSITDCDSKSRGKNDEEDHEGSVELTSIKKCAHVVNSMADNTNERLRACNGFQR